MATLPVLRIGTPISAGSSQVADRFNWTRVFSEDSTTKFSHVLTIEDGGLALSGFNLQGGDQICLEMVVGCHEGTYFETLKYCGGKKICLTASQNYAFLPFPGRYRLVYTGSRLGLFNVFAQPVPFDHFEAMSRFVGGCDCCDESAGPSPWLIT